MIINLQANNAIDENDDDFFNGNGETIISDCFNAVLEQNVNNNNLMPQTFKRWVTESVAVFFRWPSNTAFGNILKYLHEQYTVNVQTNLRTHCERRLKLFFKMRVYELNDMQIQLNAPNPDLFTEDDIKNAMKYTYNRQDTTNGDAGAQNRLGILLDELRACGAPFDCNIIEFIDAHWFRSLYMWLHIQRDIQNFQHAFAHVRNSWNLFRKFPLYVQRPTIPEPPKILNFAAIPMCTFQRRHIRIDTDVLYRLLCKTKLVQTKMGKREKPINITQTEFFADKSDNWYRFIDLDKIAQMVKGKKAFDFQLISDGVAATVLYLKPKQPEVPISKAEVLRQYNAGLFYYLLGIDPGMRTYNATVRRNINTGEEVKRDIFII